MLKVRKYSFNPFVEQCYLVWDDNSGKAAVIDPGFISSGEESLLAGTIADEGLKPAAVLLTHAHPDHIYGVRALQDRYGVPVYLAEADARMLPLCARMAEGFGMPVPDTSFKFTAIRDSELLEIGTMRFEVMATPGHTPGSVCFICREEELVFTGDTLFAGSIGRTDLPLGDYDSLIVSVMDRLMGLDGSFRILPGHGGSSTIADERTTNPFLEPFNEPEQCIPEE